ncbi:hypothetical protein HJC23_002004 [Cyclotella cryptica]|uniref:Uncharacterized protein n=1 Tax=Cyclotella cryptica TaxID=29204 RepID=A0ABD3P1Z0_9STRA|eukprot:CCRYP_018380-RA/>CCRYP_018380-RA protein AED:0.43 eAED:0.43 QI:0/-1/0/1/-1/1/1/0/361
MTSRGKRVRVLPGSQLPPHLKGPSSAPPWPPLNPSHLCRIAVVGDESSGKSSVVRKFILRESAHDDRAVKCEDVASIEMPSEAGSAYTSVGTSLAASLTTGPTTASLENSLAEYHKKDVTIWHRLHQVEKQICVRVQVWDMNLHPAPAEDAGASPHSVNSESSHRCVHNAPLLALLTRCNCAIVTVRYPDPASTSTFDSFASISSKEWNAIPHDQNSSRSHWHQLNVLESKIHRWVIFLRSAYENEFNNASTRENGLNISVLLTQADQIISSYSPQHWMELSLCMQRVCRRLGIVSWTFGSCVNTAQQIDLDKIHGTERLSNHQRFLQRMQMEQRSLLQDIEESIEAAFVELIQICLDSSQ